MAQNLFESVKQAVRLRDAAEQYGLTVQRNGMIVCPFHDDKDPSMKLNDDYFYCFGCGATGDVIDFVARLFQISTKEAAEKLATDFGLSYDHRAPRPPPRRPAISAQIAQQRENYTFRTLVAYNHQLQDWKEKFDPKSPEDEIDPRFLEAMQQKEYVGYLIDLLISGSPEEKAEICAERNPVIRRIAHRLSQLSHEGQLAAAER